MNIYEKMQKATNQIITVAKNLNVAGQYNAVGEGDVLKAIKPIEQELGIYSYPFSRNVIESNVLTDDRGKIKLFMRVETVYRFINIENTKEFIDVTSYGDGVDTQDKAPGKAMTYADKYALLKAYKIETGDDPDKDISKEYSSSSKNENITWLSNNQLADTLKCTDQLKVANVIKTYTTETKKMSNKNKKILETHLDKLRAEEMNTEVSQVEDLF